MVKDPHHGVRALPSLLVALIHMCIELLLSPHKHWEIYLGESFSHLWHYMYFILFTLSYFIYFMINYIPLF